MLHSMATADAANCSINNKNIKIHWFFHPHRQLIRITDIDNNLDFQLLHES